MNAVVFDHDDVVVTVPDDRLLELAEAAIADLHVVLWAGIDVSDDAGRARAAQLLVDGIAALATQAGIAALDHTSGIGLRIGAEGASTN